MLILTRKLGEHIVINDDIKVYFMERLGNHIKLGIEAPKSVPIHRPELGKRVKEESK
jgi:carbon storage regulator|tara:strand:+ start:4843 stop:5013 length:171 start_codon:yes stop_codon:yes gene_type:complete